MGTILQMSFSNIGPPNSKVGPPKYTESRHNIASLCRRNGLAINFRELKLLTDVTSQQLHTSFKQ